MKIILTLLLLFSFYYAAHSQTKDELIEKGIDHIYKIEFDSAEVVFDKVISQSPSNTEGHFFKTMVQWWRIYIDRSNESYDQEFFNRVDKVVSVADAVLRNNKNDESALFYKGGAIGYRGLLRSLRSSWLKAGTDGREALTLIENAVRVNPNNPDAAFGMGLYNYFAEYVPDKYPVLKPLMFLFPKGDKAKGLLQIRHAIDNSRFARTEARNILGHLFLRYEENFANAELQFRLLHEKYPNNPVFENDLGSSLVGQAKWADALQVWQNILAKSDSGYTGYTTLRLKRDANYYSMLCLLRLNRTGEAENYAKNAISFSEELDRSDNAFKSYSYLFAGQVFSKNGNKSKAREYFDKVLAMENFNNIHLEANRNKSEL